MSDLTGFGSISRRQSSKPIIAAVNGGAYGGGVEIILNCDIVVASDDAKFALPEVKRGVVAAQGGKHRPVPVGTTSMGCLSPNIKIDYFSFSLGIPRLFQIAGHQVSCQGVLAGRSFCLPFQSTFFISADTSKQVVGSRSNIRIYVLYSHEGPHFL